MDKKSGWVEKRKFERIVATLKMEYQIVSGPETKKLLAHEHYQETTVDHLPKLSQKSSLYEAVTKDISMGGLALVSQQALQAGMVLEVSLHLPNFKTILKFLAEIRHVQTTVEMGRTLFQAGIQIMAINKADVEKMEDYLLAQKSQD